MGLWKRRDQAAPEIRSMIIILDAEVKSSLHGSRGLMGWVRTEMNNRASRDISRNELIFDIKKAEDFD